MYSMELTNFLEHIRLGRSITQEDFVDGICSIRQYQRYRNGDSAIPYERVEKFAEKLGIPSKKLLNQFEDAKNKQARKVSEFYNAVIRNETKKLDSIKKELAGDVIIDQEVRVHFKHAIIFEKYIKQKITKADAIRKTMRLINYPEVLKQDYFTDIEVLIMSSLIDFYDVPKFETLLERLGQLFETEASIFSGGNEMVKSLILMRLAQGNGILEQHNNVIYFANKGLENGMQKKNYHLFEYFYYFKAISHFELEQYDSYEEALFNLYNVLQIEKNDDNITHFTQLVEKDFGINFNGFVLHYLNKYNR